METRSSRRSLAREQTAPRVPNDHNNGDGHLIIVCCHAIYKPFEETISWDVLQEANWLLEDFQRSNSSGKVGEHLTFVSHIKSGYELRMSDWNDEKESLLVFSGGATKDTTNRTESESYKNALEHMDYTMNTNIFRERAVACEVYATDSYQNLLFSLVTYWAKKGKWPGHITVITHAFKAERFLKLHAQAIRWPADRIKVQGMDPPFSLRQLRTIQDAEQMHGFAPWAVEKHGGGRLLRAKRRQRNWDPSCLTRLCNTPDLPQEVKALLKFSSNAEFPVKLPWEEDYEG